MRRLSVFLILAFTIFLTSPVFAQQPACDFTGNPYRPGGECEDQVPYVHSDINSYQITCSTSPQVATEIFTCGPPPTTTCPTGGTCIPADALIDMSKATLGGLGPNASTLSFPSDILSQLYPFNALVDRPLPTANQKDIPREAYRTFWRLLNLPQQLNAKASFLQAYQLNYNTEKRIFDTKYPYLPYSTATGDPELRHTQTPPAPESGGYSGNICAPGQVDTLEYIFPTNPNLVSVVDSAYGQQKFQTYPTTINGQPGLVWDKSYDASPNTYFEEYTFDNQYIYHLRDTTWTNTCSDGSEAYYSLFQPGGQEGGQYLHRCVTPGQSYTVTAEIRAYSKSTCGPCDAGFGTSTTASTTYSVQTQGDLLIINNTGGSGAGDIKTFKKGVGLVGFSDPGKFSGGTGYTGANNYEGELKPISNTCSVAASGSTVDAEDAVLISYSDLIAELKAAGATCLTQSPICSNAVDIYNSLPTTLKLKYNALLPFQLDNARGYLALLFGTNGKYPEKQVLTENLPYVLALNDALNSPQYGILTTLSPSWLNSARRSQLTLDATILPDEENPYYTSAAGDQAKYVWPKDLLSSFQGCLDFNPEGPSLASPQTFPSSVTSQSTPEEATLKEDFLVPVTIEQTQDICNTEQGLYRYQIRYDGSRATRPDDNSTLVDNVGRSIAVLNNPKLVDIDRALTAFNPDSSNYSLYYQFLPRFAQPDSEESQQPMPILADNSASHNVDFAGVGSSQSKEPIARVGGQSEINLCKLRNLWLVPASLQKATEQSCEDLTPGNALSPSFSPSTSTTASCEVKQHLFEPSCNGQLCYQFFDSFAGQTQTECNGQFINPYLTIAVALNESGGLVSDNDSGSNVKNFGCDPFGRLGIASTPTSKFSCFINTITNDCGKSDTDILSEYGYTPGHNLFSIMNILGAPTTSVFVSHNDAISYASRLNSLLSSEAEQNRWYAYYKGYIEDYQQNSCTQ